MTSDRYKLQFKNIVKTVRDAGVLFVEGNDYFESFPLTRKETKKVLKRKAREIKEKK
ncbi:MAG: hypothetical protein M0Q88_00105 [Bacilli bacterium]|nr:hypothetical protein [Bacilli bacterium]